MEHMRRAMAQAATVRSTTAPNPWVGCVDRAAGSDAGRRRRVRRSHRTPRGPHAEVTALAGPATPPRGATLYVTLEPCAHQGRTPPCTDAIIAAGVARVVIGIEDPDEQVAGRGIAALRAAGIEVTRGRGGRRGGRAAGPLPQAPHDRAALGGPQDGGQPRWPHRRARRHQPLDHRARRRVGTCTGCAPAPTPCWSGPAPCGPTIPS